MFCSPEIRRPKAETRKKAEIRNQKSEGRAGGWPFSVFGLRISFGFRISVLGFGMARTDFRAALPECLAALFSVDVPSGFWFLTVQCLLI